MTEWKTSAEARYYASWKHTNKCINLSFFFCKFADQYWAQMHWFVIIVMNIMGYTKWEEVFYNKRVPIIVGFLHMLNVNDCDQFLQLLLRNMVIIFNDMNNVMF